METKTNLMEKMQVRKTDCGNKDKLDGKNAGKEDRLWKQRQTMEKMQVRKTGCGNKDKMEGRKVKEKMDRKGTTG